jgi:uncharacterized membrane protein
VKGALGTPPGVERAPRYNQSDCCAAEIAMNARRVSLSAVSIALVFVLIRSIQVPIVATEGFTHPGAVAEIFVSLAFGPSIGLVAAAGGAALADLTSGQFAKFAPLTLLAHGTLGFLAGYLGRKKQWPNMLAGWLVGGIALVGIYFVGESLVANLYGGYAAALIELPFNLVQVGLGIFGIFLYRVTRAAYPRIDQLTEHPRFEEV